MQEVRRFKPSAISRRSLAAAGFHRTCVTGGILEHSPPGTSAAQFEALLIAARASSCASDSALAAMLGLPVLRIFEATGADITDLGEEHGYRMPRVQQRQPRSSWCPCRQPPRAIDPAIRARTCGPRHDRLA